MQYSEFGIQARAQMLRKGVKNSQIAQKLGISNAYLCDILRGARAGKKYKPQIAEMLNMGDSDQNNQD
jgi:transcriptional regulator with XRE-family HTH domain